jgi:RNA polymerase sigma-70 factor (ECF subfamily)
MLIDVLLLAAVRRGSEHALEQLIDKYAAYLCVIIRNIVGERMSYEDIEETASDVFFALWKNADRVEKLKPWLAATARNKAKNKLRGFRDELPLENDCFSDDNVILEDILISDYERDAMKTAVLLLDSPDREIFMQHYYESRTVAEIAEETGMSESAIKQRLVRGRNKLRIYLISQEVFC